MKEIAIKLIEDDIRITQLITAFETVGIDASEYYPNTLDVIFGLAGVDEVIAESDELNRQYLKRIKSGSNKSIYDTREKITELATEIFLYLRSI